MQGTYSRNSCTHVRDFKSKPTLEGVRVAARLALASTAARPKREKVLKICVQLDKLTRPFP